MIMVNEMAFVGYPVTDKQRTRDFYEGVLGLRPTMDSAFPEGYWIEYDIGAGTLALSNFWKPAVEPAMGPAAGLEVENFEATVALLKSKGVPFIDGPHETRVCFMVMVTDPDGNSLWIHQRKPGRGRTPQVSGIPFVCYPVTDRQRALDFYTGFFGLKIDEGYVAPDGFWSEADVDAGTLAICSFWKPSAAPSTGPAAAFELENFPDAVTALKAAGVPFAMEPLETPVCHLAVITDPDGNSLFIHKRKPVGKGC